MKMRLLQPMVSQGELEGSLNRRKAGEIIEVSKAEAARLEARSIARAPTPKELAEWKAGKAHEKKAAQKAKK